MDLDSLHEPAHRTLMQLYAQSGQKSAALRQYEVCQDLLASELDLDPSEETDLLYQRIRGGVWERSAEKDETIIDLEGGSPETLPLRAC